MMDMKFLKIYRGLHEAGRIDKTVLASNFQIAFEDEGSTAVHLHFVVVILISLVEMRRRLRDGHN